MTTGFESPFSGRPDDEYESINLGVYDEQKAEITALRQQLAECERRADEQETTLHNTICSANRLSEQLASVTKDAERYRWLRDTLHGAVSGGVKVNDDALVYQECEPGEEVRVYWYPDTPVGFYECKASTLDAAIDAAIAKLGADKTGEKL